MLTVAQAAAIIGHDVRYTRRLIKAGKLKAIKINPRLYLLDEAEVERYAQARQGKKGART